MSMDLEDRLGTHLRSTSDRYTPSGNLEMVRRTAKRRSMRTRAAVGACGLLALAGAAALVPGSDNPRALITAADPTPVGVVEIDNETTTEPAPDQPAPEVTPMQAGPPPAHRIVGDGNGGFAAIAATTSTGRAQFVRSDDGETWFDAGELQVESGRLVGDLRFLSGSFVVSIDDSRHDQTSFGLIDPQLAVSADLVEWQFIDFEFDDEPRSMRYDILDIAVASDQIGVLVVGTRIVDYETDYGVSLDDLCGSSRSPDGSFLTLCTGEQIEVADGDARADGVISNARLYESANGQPLRHQPSESDLSASDIFSLGDSIEQIDRGPLSEGERLEWADDIEGDERVDVLLVTSALDEPETVTLLRQGERFAAVWQRDDNFELAYLPEPVRAEPATGLFPQLAVGPAGWAALINTGGSLFREIDTDGWVLSGFLPTPSVSISSPDGTQTYHYSSRNGSTPPNVQWSLFGDLRLFRPGSEQVVGEVAGPDVRASSAPVGGTLDLPLTSEFDQQLTVDGWTLSGDPLRGPLVLTSREGVETVFDDGFAFTNQDTSDGVEVDVDISMASPFAMLRLDSPLQFFDADGEPTVAFSTHDTYASLVLPVIGTPNDKGGFDPPRPGRPSTSSQSWLVYSEDGISWRVIQEINSATVSGRSDLVVGDDEILLLDPSGATRIELDE